MIVGAIVVVTFMILELFNRRDDFGNFLANFPIPLFVVMWLLSAAFVGLVMSLPRSSSLLRLVPRVVLVILIAWLWVGLVADQMPCFLGVPNCD